MESEKVASRDGMGLLGRPLWLSRERQRLQDVLGCGECGNIWPLLGPGAAIEQVFLPAQRHVFFCFLNGLSLALRN